MKMLKNSSSMKFIVPCMLVSSLAISNLNSVSLYDGAEVAAKTTSGVGFAAVDGLIIDKNFPSTINKDEASLVEQIKGDTNINLKRLSSFVKSVVDVTLDELLDPKESSKKLNDAVKKLKDAEKSFSFLKKNDPKEQDIKNALKDAHDKIADLKKINKNTLPIVISKEDIPAENTLNIIKATIPAIATQFAKNKFANKDKDLMKSYILAEVKAIFENKYLLAKEAGLAASLVNFENVFGKHEKFTDLLNLPFFLETITKFVVSDVILKEVSVLNDKNYADSMVKRIAVKSLSKIITKIVMEIASPTIKVACKKANEEYTKKFNTNNAEKTTTSKVAAA